MFTISNTRLLKSLFAVLIAVVLAACGGSGSSNAPGVAAEPVTIVGGISYVDAENLLPVITAVEIPADGRAVVSFQLTDKNLQAITDLSAADFRLSLAKLQASELGGLSGNWQSYINRIEQPGVGPGTAAKMQASTESGSDGDLTNNTDGTYQYRFAASVISISQNIIDQAEIEGLDLSYQPSRTHRIAMQFENHSSKVNPVYDWLPNTGVANGVSHYDVVATENCNSCHGDLALHGGGRIETRYCVTCHNPGSSDANSGNSVDFKQLIHKTHRGADLPSVQAGGEYAIWGFRDTKHDYSSVQFSRDIRDCQVCHAGTTTGTGGETLTRQGDNWSEFASRNACGSCHDDLDFDQHYGGQSDDNNCMSCHSLSGVAGSITSRHKSLSSLSIGFAAQILAIRNTSAGEFPQIDFSIVNPQDNDNPYDILNDPQWTSSGASLSVKLAWSTQDYTNTGNQGNNANSVSINALSSASANGDGSYQVTSAIVIPDGSQFPNIAASGSGAAVIEGRAVVGDERVPLTNVVEFFSIDEANAVPQPRRQIVSLDNCLACHGSLSLHGGNRTDSIDSCVTCHNPRNTDIAQRPSASPPPSDGKREESIDFKTMIHAIHAGDFREQPLQVVGYGARVHVFDATFPNKLQNCLSCHIDSSYSLPMTDSVLASSNNTGGDVQDPADDIVTTRASAVCSSCHDSTRAKAHMQANGGHFSATQDDIDAGAVLEQCEVCHGEGRVYSVSSKHGL